MRAKITLMASECEAFTDKEIIALYCEARRGLCEEDDFEKMRVFKELFPREYSRFSAVARKRLEIRKSIEAMQVLDRNVYFGTLTFNSTKNLNKEEIKRKEAFEKLNSVFEYVLLVEEYGEDNGRYHIHFLGVFKDKMDFNSFVACWPHSRQNLRLLKEDESIDKYLVKYLTKDLPRLRRNKRLSGLTKRYKEYDRLERKNLRCYILPEKREAALTSLGEFALSKK